MNVKRLMTKVIVTVGVIIFSSAMETDTRVVMAAETLQGQEVYRIEASSSVDAIVELENAKESYAQTIDMNCDKEGVVQEVMAFERNRVTDFGYYTYKDYIYSYSGKRYLYTSKNLKISYEVDKNQEVLIDSFIEQTVPALLGETDYETICKVHDYICNWVTYDYETYEGRAENYSAYNAIFEKKTVCSGYAKFFQKYMEAIGIESYIVSSEELRHAWNIVNLDGKWYHIDCTWDDVENGISRRYFLKGSSGLVNTPAWQYTNVGNIILSTENYV